MPGEAEAVGVARRPELPVGAGERPRGRRAPLAGGGARSKGSLTPGPLPAAHLLDKPLALLRPDRREGGGPFATHFPY